MKKTITSLFLLVITITANAQQLVRHYPMDSGQTTTDIVGGQTASTSWTLTTDRNGNPNSALSSIIPGGGFNIPSFNLDYYSVSLWVYMSARNGESPIITSGTNRHLYSFGSISDRLGTYIGTNFNTSTTAFPLGVWKHLVITGTPTELEIYMDGVLLDYPGNSFSNSSSPIDKIGVFGGQRFVGEFDDLRFYDAPLSATQVQALFNDQPVVPELQLVRHYPFDGNGSEIINSQNATVYFNWAATEDRFGNANSASLNTATINANITIPQFNESNLTASIWVRNDTANGDAAIITGTPSRHLYTYAQFDNKFGPYIANYYALNNSELVFGEWTNIIFVMYGSTSIRYYKNGVFLSQTIGFNNVTNAIQQIGHYNNGQCFIGALDDLRLYRGTLSDTEVADLYTSMSGNSVSVKETKNVNSFKIYPNPASNQININGIESGSLIQLMDLTGKVMVSQKVTNNKAIISTENISNGIYFVRTENKGVVSTQKVVISK